MQFRSTVLLGGKTATGIAVPPEIVAALGAGQRPAVRVTINGYTYRSTVAPRDGLFMLPLSAEHRAGAGIAAGDDVVVDLELDTAPREVSVPADFQAALDGDEDAARRFTALAYSHRLRHVLAIEGAKSVETRQRRIAKAVETLRVEAGGAS
ncbi:MAG: YdeI/OmpD-associated family protein [Dehalococcoidia bacterium]